MVTDEQLAFYGILALAAFLVGLSKCGLAVMMGALITPLVAMVIPLDQAIGLMLPILILGDVFAAIGIKHDRLCGNLGIVYCSAEPDQSTILFLCRPN